MFSCYKTLKHISSFILFVVKLRDIYLKQVNFDNAISSGFYMIINPNTLAWLVGKV